MKPFVITVVALVALILLVNPKGAIDFLVGIAVLGTMIASSVFERM